MKAVGVLKLFDPPKIFVSYIIKTESQISDYLISRHNRKK